MLMLFPFNWFILSDEIQINLCILLKDRFSGHVFGMDILEINSELVIHTYCSRVLCHSIRATSSRPNDS